MVPACSFRSHKPPSLTLVSGHVSSSSYLSSNLNNKNMWRYSEKATITKHNFPEEKEMRNKNNGKTNKRHIWHHPLTKQKTTTKKKKSKKNCNKGTALERSVEKTTGVLTLLAPYFRLHLSFVFFFLNKLSIGKKFIRKVERLNVKQHRSRWDGSLWAVSSGATLFAKAYYCRLWQWKSYSKALFLLVDVSEHCWMSCW